MEGRQWASASSLGESEQDFEFREKFQGQGNRELELGEKRRRESGLRRGRARRKCRGTGGRWRENRGGTPRLEPWHPEGQPTCRAKPLGIGTAPSMMNRAVTYDKCSTVYVTYFTIKETPHRSSFPLSMWNRDHLILHELLCLHLCLELCQSPTFISDSVLTVGQLLSCDCRGTATMFLWIYSLSCTQPGLTARSKHINL